MTPAKQARINAGLTLAQAARRARISAGYLRRVERRGQASLVLATRLARLYGCSRHLFL